MICLDINASQLCHQLTLPLLFSETFLISRLCSTSHPSIFVFVLLSLSSIHNMTALLAGSSTFETESQTRKICVIFISIFHLGNDADVFFCAMHNSLLTDDDSKHAVPVRQQRRLRAGNSDSFKLGINPLNSMWMTENLSFSLFLHVWSLHYIQQQ